MSRMSLKQASDHAQQSLIDAENRRKAEHYCGIEFTDKYYITVPKLLFFAMCGLSGWAVVRIVGGLLGLLRG